MPCKSPTEGQVEIEKKRQMQNISDTPKPIFRLLKLVFSLNLHIRNERQRSTMINFVNVGFGSFASCWLGTKVWCSFL